jgi:hypothetical protein
LSELATRKDSESSSGSSEEEKKVAANVNINVNVNVNPGFSLVKTSTEIEKRSGSLKVQCLHLYSHLLYSTFVLAFILYIFIRDFHLREGSLDLALEVKGSHLYPLEENQA